MVVSQLSCIEFTAVEYEQIYRSYEERIYILQLLKDGAGIWRNDLLNKCALATDSA